MSSINLYDMTVPTFQRGLEQLIHILKKAEQWAEETNTDKQTLIDGKLSPDMLPLTFQIQTVCNTTKNALTRIGGNPDLPTFPDDEKTFPEFYSRINATLDLLKAAEREKFVGPEDRVLVKMGTNGDKKFVGLGYVRKFVFPNFFFHHTAAYLILRNLGAPIGKWDYLGAEGLEDE